MPMRDLFCVVETGEKPVHDALDQALALARTYGARAFILVAGPRSTAPYTVFNAGTVGDLVQAENEQTLGRLEALAATANDKLSKSGAKGSVDSCLDSFTDIGRRVRAHALCNDVTVLDRPGGVLEHSQVLFEEVLFSAGRPALLPPGDAKPVERIERVTLAWDGSSHAARALACVLGLFDQVKQIDIAVVQGEKNLGGIVPPSEIGSHIERHGVRAATVELRVEKSVAATLDAHAQTSGADLLAMGAFGRSRLREFVLGGVTREISRSSAKPLLLAH